MATPHREETLSFRPRARIMRTLGNELISDDAVALIELVKNAYDADASRVLIRLVPPLVRPAEPSGEATSEGEGIQDVASPDDGAPEAPAPGLGGIDVIDNGHGMTFQTVKTAWLEPATPRKRKAKVSAAGRRLTGEKGIGRLASARLAAELLLTTRAAGSDTEVRLLMDWSEFDKPDLYLDEVSRLLAEGDPEVIRPGGDIDALWDEDNLPGEAARSHGTMLHMGGLTEEWDRNRIEGVRSRLRRLISPFDRDLGTDADGADGPGGFSIRLEVPGADDDLSGPVEPPELLEHPGYRIYGSVQSDGSHDLQYERRGQSPERVLEGKRLTVEKGKERVPPTTGPFQIELRVWDRSQGDLADIARLQNLDDEGKVSTSTIRNIRADLDEISGVSIYRDGFRVLPYGEPNDDWLRLGDRRVQNPSLRVSNNQVVGYVSIGADANPDLVDQSNREGLQNTTALRDLRSLVLEILSRLEVRRRDYRKGLGAEPAPPAPDEPVFNATLPSLFDELNVDGIADHVVERYPEDRALQRLVADRQKTLREQVSEIQEVLARYRRLSTVGMIVDTVLHDARTPLALIRGRAEMGARAVRRALTPPVDDCEEVLAETLERLDAIETHAATLDAVFQKIEPFGGRKRGRPKTVVLEEVIARMFELRARDLADLDVNVSLPSGSTEVTVDSNEMSQVFTNLLDNALYWLPRSDRPTREVAVEVDRTGEGVEILFSDNGPGVDPDIRPRLFDPYATLKLDGVGLGLTIAGEIVTEYYNGTLQLVRQGPLPGATFKIILRRRV